MYTLWLQKQHRTGQKKSVLAKRALTNTSSEESELPVLGEDGPGHQRQGGVGEGVEQAGQQDHSGPQLRSVQLCQVRDQHCEGTVEAGKGKEAKIKIFQYFSTDIIYFFITKLHRISAIRHFIFNLNNSL